MRNLPNIKLGFLGIFLFFALTFSYNVIQPAHVLAASQTLYNPLPVALELYCPTAACDLKTMFLLIVRYILAIIPIFSVLFIIIGGFKMIMSSGNEEALVKAKKTVLWAVLGLVIALMSFSLIAIVQNLLGVNIN